MVGKDGILRNPKNRPWKTSHELFGRLDFQGLHPWNLTWNLKRSPWKRRFLLETIIFRFHVKFRGSRKFFIIMPVIIETYLKTPLGEHGTSCCRSFSGPWLLERNFIISSSKSRNFQPIVSYITDITILNTPTYPTRNGPWCLGPPKNHTPNHPGCLGLQLGGSSQILKSAYSNHGDRKSPRRGVVGPLPNRRTSWIIDGGWS